MAEDWQRSWLKSRNNPLVFVRDVLGATPEPWQAAALKLSATMIACRSGLAWGGKDHAAGVARAVVLANAVELQGSSSSELSGSAARHHLARNREVAPAPAGGPQSDDRRAGRADRRGGRR